MSEIKLSELKDIMGDMFLKQGLTEEVVRLSQFIDGFIVEQQMKRERNNGAYKRV